MNPAITRRHLLRALGIGTGAVALGGLAGCAPSADDSDPPDRTDGDNEVNEFTFTSWSLNEETSKPVIQGIVDGYAADEGVTIETVAYPYNEYLQQLTLQARGNEASGAAQLDIAWLGALAAMGKLTDLGDATKDVSYTEAAFASGNVGGIQYGLPWTTGSIGLLANTELLDAAGIGAHPRSIEDFEAALESIKAANPDVVPYAASTKAAQLKDILVWMRTFGCKLVDDANQVTIGDDASIEAVAWYKSLYDRKLIAADVDRFDARALFAQGRAAIYDDAIVGKGVVAAESPDADLVNKLAPMARPVVTPGDTPQAMLWGHVVVVFDDDAAGAAAEFAKFITSDRPTAVDYFTKTALPPTTTDALDDPAVADDEFTKTWTDLITIAAKPNPFWTFPAYAQMEDAVAQQVQAVLVGQSSPADAMRKAGEQVQGLI